jgi:CRISPR-associated endonuclease/helicase Cas3
MGEFYAHSGEKADHSDWQRLRAHLVQVAKRAQQWAVETRPADSALAEWAFAAGLLHDLGKYRREFQRMIRGEPVQKENTYHKQAGSAKAYEARNYPVALAIAGHHGGLPDAARLASDYVAHPSGRDTLRAIWSAAVADTPELNGPLGPPFPAGVDPLTAELLTRLIFSCLVDADWGDTAEHQRACRGLALDPAPAPLDPLARLQHLLRHIEDRARACKDPKVAAVRAEVLKACLAAAEQPPGLFSLTVPTGGGKTLSGLAFALKHATTHGLRRIVYVAPYLSILEQNARVIRRALGLGPDAPELFEHHSLAEPAGRPDENLTEREDRSRRAENWAAPLIITTSVQFYESLFAKRPGQCRKVHNVARSVVLLDECQTLPPGLVAPTCSMLRQLAEGLGCTVVLCTATQPAWHHRPELPEGLHGVREIAPPSLNLFSRLRRVRMEWPSERDGPLDWPQVAERMLAERQGLCVVNTRKAAKDLFLCLRERRPGTALHLSTAMCPAHRLAVIDQVKGRLSKGDNIYLVSTQLIEAGVDLDFPFLMRELGPLEAIAQAAGRCNREGLLNGPNGEPGGRVVAFRSRDGKLPGDHWYRAGLVEVEHCLRGGRPPQIDDPDDLRNYFLRLYRSGELDKEGIQNARRRCQFEEVANRYQLIADGGEPVVVASWEEKAAEIESLLIRVGASPSIVLYRKLAQFQVNLRPYEMEKLGLLAVEESPGVRVWRGGYDRDLGLSEAVPDSAFVV